MHLPWFFNVWLSFISGSGSITNCVSFQKVLVLTIKPYSVVLNLVSRGQHCVHHHYKNAT